MAPTGLPNDRVLENTFICDAEGFLNFLLDDAGGSDGVEVLEGRFAAFLVRISCSCRRMLVSICVCVYTERDRERDMHRHTHNTFAKQNTARTRFTTSHTYT